MKKPEFRDAVYESFFAGGYSSAVHSGALDKGLFKEFENFYQSMDRGKPLVSFCHFIDTYYGNRDAFIAELEDQSLGPIVRLIYYARNAYIHCAWDVGRMERESQKEKLRQASALGQLHEKAPKFSIVVDKNDRLHVDGLMSICMAIADSIKPSQNS